jgi:hypothetical protein
MLIAAGVGMVLVSRGASAPRSVGRNEAQYIEPVDAYADLDLATGCDPSPKPGVVQFRNYVLARFGGRDLGIGVPCTSTTKPSEHTEGRAWDWGVSPGAVADTFLEWLLAAEGDEPHAILRRAGVMYVIFNRRMFRAYGPREWLPYSGTNPHVDHVHLSFSRAGASGATSFYRGNANV